ncbi:MAG: MBL fold metallo-hydrolase [Pyrinomonadaceae bacterium]|nr:MBL fold metallo-hydrolase [Pyrinomonadaceae bacterium]
MLFGDHRIEIIPDTLFKLDGGAMFGIVPRVIWERVCPPDDKNRIAMNMNCVFIETAREKILIETGIGEKWTEKQAAMYGIERERPFADSLRAITGYSPEDITIVINTHLHFDHAGGNTILSVPLASAGGQFASESPANWPPTHAGGSDLIPQFKNARYLVSKSELAHADSPHERDRASYLPENWQPMRDTGQLEAMPDRYEIEGITVTTERGHSETMQTWRLDSGGKTLYGFADLIPMKAHISLPYIAGYDLYPTETLEFKKRILPQAVKEGWYCLFYHEVDHPLCQLVENGGKLTANNI